MKIIIVGCGKVGVTLADHLGKEHHDIILIDKDEIQLAKVPDHIDAIKLYGNGASVAVIEEADISHADLFVAVTGEDEVNLLCCLIAQKVGHCKTIARVRNPIYSDDIEFISEKMGVSLIVNPELATAKEIEKIIRFPQALEINTFAQGNVELVKFKLQSAHRIEGKAIRDIEPKLLGNVLICGVEREGKITIPDGNFVLETGDLVSVLAATDEYDSFFKRIGISMSTINKVMMIGGSKVALYLSMMLENSKIQMKLIENDLEKCNQLAEALDNVIVIHGDGTDRHLLKEEGIDYVDAFIALTNMDEENIILSMFAKDNTNAKTVTKINHVSFDEFLGKLDLDAVIYPKYITSDIITTYVRSLQNAMGSNIEKLYHLYNNKAEALEFVIKEESEVTQKQLMNLSLKPNLLVGCIHRQGEIIIPKGNDQLKKGDTVVVITTQEGLKDICDILA